MQVSTDDSSDSGLIPATQIARVQRVDVDVSALILQATAMMLYPQQSCLSTPFQPTLFPSMLPPVTLTTHCAPVVTVSTADPPQSAMLRDLSTIRQPARRLFKGQTTFTFLSPDGHLHDIV